MLLPCSTWNWAVACRAPYSCCCLPEFVLPFPLSEQTPFTSALSSLLWQTKPAELTRTCFDSVDKNLIEHFGKESLWRGISTFHCDCPVWHSISLGWFWALFLLVLSSAVTQSHLLQDGFLNMKYATLVTYLHFVNLLIFDYFDHKNGSFNSDLIYLSWSSPFLV